MNEFHFSDVDLSINYTGSNVDEVVHVNFASDPM